MENVRWSKEEQVSIWMIELFLIKMSLMYRGQHFLKKQRGDCSSPSQKINQLEIIRHNQPQTSKAHRGFCFASKFPVKCEKRRRKKRHFCCRFHSSSSCRFITKNKSQTIEPGGLWTSIYNNFGKENETWVLLTWLGLKMEMFRSAIRKGWPPLTRWTEVQISSPWKQKRNTDWKRRWFDGEQKK